jgi:hypothetical protein
MTRAKTALPRPEAGRGSKVVRTPALPGGSGCGSVRPNEWKERRVSRVPGEAMLELLRLTSSPRTSQ